MNKNVAVIDVSKPETNHLHPPALVRHVGLLESQKTKINNKINKPNAKRYLLLDI